uniref:Uncharacterized protein n=1 Tax=Anguilla anguilla TaxID=7936 RepID=A0A0E9WKW0_ANGAN
MKTQDQDMEKTHALMISFFSVLK